MNGYRYTGSAPDVGAVEGGTGPNPPAPIRDLTSLTLTKSSGAYVLAGRGPNNKAVSWHGPNRANALAALDKLTERIM